MFNVTVCLSAFFADYRSKSRICISENLELISDLEEKLSNIFGIQNFCLVCNDVFLPPSETVHVLKEGDLLSVVPKKNEIQLLDREFYHKKSKKKSKRIKEIEEEFIEPSPKKKKKKKEKTEQVEDQTLIYTSTPHLYSIGDSNKSKKRKRVKDVVEKMELSQSYPEKTEPECDINNCETPSNEDRKKALRRTTPNVEKTQNNIELSSDSEPSVETSKPKVSWSTQPLEKNTNHVQISSVPIEENRDLSRFEYSENEPSLVPIPKPQITEPESKTEKQQTVKNWRKDIDAKLSQNRKQNVNEAKGLSYFMKLAEWETVKSKPETSDDESSETASLSSTVDNQLPKRKRVRKRRKKERIPTPNVNMLQFKHNPPKVLIGNVKPKLHFRFDQIDESSNASEILQETTEEINIKPENEEVIILNSDNNTIHIIQDVSLITETNGDVLENEDLEKAKSKLLEQVELIENNSAILNNERRNFDSNMEEISSM